MSAMRDKIRDRAEQRIFALETLNSIISWINSTNPQTIYKQDKGVQALSDDDFKLRFRDWINTSGKLIESANALPTLMVEDAIKIMKEMTFAEQAATPESK